MSRLSTWKLTRFAAASLCLAVPSVASADPVLIATQECPATGTHNACLPVTFRLEDDLRDRIVERRESAEGIVQSYRLGGRLNGGKRQIYRLDYLCDAPAGCEPNPALSFLGASPNDRSIVLTDRGAFEIDTKGFEADKVANLIVVDQRKQKVVARFVSYDAFPATLLKSKADIELWIDRDGVCVSAIRDRAELLKTSQTACKGQAMVQDVLNVADNRALFERLLQMRELEHFKIDRIAPDGATLQAEGGARALVSQLRGTSLIAIRFSCDDCTE